MIHNLIVYFKDVIDPNSVCKNPEISVALPMGVTIVCLNDDNVHIQINDDFSGPFCLDFIVKCSDTCVVCDDQIIHKCFCVTSDHCTNCSTCVNNICVSRCENGQVCVGDTCSDCGPDKPCPCNQQCIQGKCQCPPDKPIKRADGCCVQCIEGQTPLGPCEVCVDGMIVPKECPNGHCNPDNGDCQQCLVKEHCEGPNECCIGGQCKCCTGYIRNPITLECEPEPPCTSEEECRILYGPCFTCYSTGCGPKTCPPGQVTAVINGECQCVPGCSPDRPCPPGSGCINGGCVPCDQLNCTGVGLQCEFAVGCHCVGTVCEPIDCNLSNVTLEWKRTPGTPGTPVPGSGLPALTGTTNIVALGIVYGQPPTGSAYQNHRFDLAITNGTSGTFTLYNVPGQGISLGSGTSVSFDLASTGPNLVGFLVVFTETGTGRTATWGFFREITAPLTAPNVWHSEFESTGTAPQMQGGTSGSLKLCANNANFQAIGVTDVVTTGTIQVTFIPDGNCLIAIVTGCGTWNGKVILQCGGQTFEVQAPELFVDPSNCCDPTDPNCDGWGTGDPCTGLSIQPIDLVILPTYGTNVDGDGEFLAVADWASAGLTFIQLFYLNPSPGCWSATSNPESSSNDLAVVTSPSQSPLGPSISALSAVFTFGDGGCIKFGHSCELRIPGCKKLQGEECMKECDNFTVTIVQTGPNTYTAVPSMQDEPVTYLWNYPGLLNNTAQTVTINPTGGASVLTVTAFYGTPTKCTDSDSLQLSTTIPGCRTVGACNYNPLANVDDGSCVFITEGTYSCILGYQPGLQSGGSGEFGGVIARKIGNNALTTNQKLTPGTYTVDYYIDGVKFCSHSLVVPQCYKCDVNGNCIPAPSDNNQGNYTTSNCDGVNCVCNIEIDIAQRACNNGQAAMYITATGDTGSYVAVVTRVDTGAVVLSGTNFTSSGLGVSTPLLCPGIYRIVVTGQNCNKSRDFQILCNACTGSSLNLTNVSHDCSLSQLSFTIVGAPCSTNYNVQLLSDTLQPLSPAVSQNYTSPGNKNIIVGVRPAGNYVVRLTDNNGCVIDKPVVICPDDLEACAIDEVNLISFQNGSNVGFTATVILNSNDGTFRVSLYEVGPGNCPSTFTPVGAPLQPSEFISGNGIHTINFVNTAIPIPPVTTCFVVVVQKTTDATCMDMAFTAVIPQAPPPQCTGSVTNVSYDTLTGKVVVSWDFSNTSNDLTVQIQTGTGPSCNPGDPVALSLDGNGEDGTNIMFGPIQQTSSTQFICVTVFDTNNPTCKASMTFTIPACSCAIEILSYEVHPDEPEVEVTYRAKCTTGLVDLYFNGTGAADGTLPNQAATQNGIWVTYNKVITLGGYPANGGTGAITIEDSANPACSHEVEVVLPPNCTSCAQVASMYLNNSVITSVKNFAGVQVVAGAYTLPGDAADLAADLYAELVDDGANFCNGSSDVHVSASRDAGVRVNQDSTDLQSLDHVVLTHGDITGSAKSYFANCGCGSITRKCDYQVLLPISASAASIVFRFATNNAGADYTGIVQIEIDTPQTFSGADLAAIEAAILGALTSTSCGNEVDAVNASYDSGTDILTIDIIQTDAGPGIIQTLELGGVDVAMGFTQSNCA